MLARKPFRGGLRMPGAPVRRPRLWDHGAVSMDEIETVAVTDLPDDFSEVADRVLLDVRENDEWMQAHVRGALHIPLDDVPARIDELDLDADLLVVCRTSGRSFRLLQYLTMRGIDGTCVRGGMVAWEAAGKPVETGPEGMYGSADS